MDFLLAMLIGTWFVGAVTSIVNAPATVATRWRDANSNHRGHS
jgi:hypothetical protein